MNVSLSVQFRSVPQSCLTLCDPMDCSMTGFPVLHHLTEFSQTHVHWVGEAIQPSQPPLSSSLAFNLFQHQGLFWWIGSSHRVAKILWVSTSASVLPTNVQDWFLLELNGLMSLQSKGLSRVFSNTTVWKRQFFKAAVTIHNHFGDQENKVCHCFHCFPIYY